MGIFVVCCGIIEKLNSSFFLSLIIQMIPSRLVKRPECEDPEKAAGVYPRLHLCWGED